MSKQSHTQGPWTNTLGLIQGHVSTTDTVIRPTIALVAQTTTSAEANAHLIAAAPEMLKWLEDMQTLIKAYPKAKCPPALDGLITKARGES